MGRKQAPKEIIRASSCPFPLRLFFLRLWRMGCDRVAPERVIDWLLFNISVSSRRTFAPVNGVIFCRRVQYARVLANLRLV